MYSLKKKKEVLDYIIENDISIYQAEKKFNINRETIRIWMYRYQNSGVKNLKTPKKYNKYTHLTGAPSAGRKSSRSASCIHPSEISAVSPALCAQKYSPSHRSGKR